MLANRIAFELREMQLTTLSCLTLQIRHNNYLVLLRIFVERTHVGHETSVSGESWVVRVSHDKVVEAKKPIT